MMDMIVYQLEEVEQILVVTEQEVLHHEYPPGTTNNNIIIKMFLISTVWQEGLAGRKFGGFGKSSLIRQT